jgi:hypothetical protein
MRRLRPVDLLLLVAVIALLVVGRYCGWVDVAVVE